MGDALKKQILKQLYVLGKAGNKEAADLYARLDMEWDGRKPIPYEQELDALGVLPVDDSTPVRGTERRGASPGEASVQEGPAARPGASLGREPAAEEFSAASFGRMSAQEEPAAHPDLSAGYVSSSVSGAGRSSYRQDGDLACRWEQVLEFLKQAQSDGVIEKGERLNIRARLEEWKRRGCQLPMPYYDELRVWGMPAEYVRLHPAREASLLRTAEERKDIGGPVAAEKYLAPYAPYSARIEEFLQELRAEIRQKEENLPIAEEAAKDLHRFAELDLLPKAKEISDMVRQGLSSTLANEQDDYAAEEQAWRAQMDRALQQARLALQNLQDDWKEALRPWEAAQRELAGLDRQSRHRERLTTLEREIGALEKTTEKVFALLAALIAVNIDEVEHLSKALADNKIFSSWASEQEVFLKDVLGQAATKEKLIELQTAYKIARRQMEAGFKDLLDPLAGRKISPRELLNRLFDQLARFVTEKVQEKLEKAQAEADINTAETYYREAAALVAKTKSVLLQDHARPLDEKTKTLLAEAEKKLETRRQRWETAEQLLQESLQAKRTPEERLAKLRAAEKAYPRHPDLPAQFEKVYEALSEQVALRLVDAYAPVREVAEGAGIPHPVDMEAAERALERAAALLEESLAYLPAGHRSEKLQEVIAKGENWRNAIERKKLERRRAEALIEEAQQALAQMQLTQARQALDGLPPDYKEWYKAHDLRERLTELQDSQTNWKTGKEAYAHRKWAEAEASFNKVRLDEKFPQREEAERLRGRAEAMRLKQEGDQIAQEQGDQWYIEAAQKYERALRLLERYGVDDDIEVAQEEMEQRLQEWRSLEDKTKFVRQVRDEVQRALKTARKAGAMADYRALYAKVEQAREQSDDPDGILVSLMHDIRHDWVRKYKEEILRVAEQDAPRPESVQQALKLAQELQEHDLLRSMVGDDRDAYLRAVAKLQGRDLDYKYQVDSRKLQGGEDREEDIRSRIKQIDRLLENRQERLLLVDESDANRKQQIEAEINDLKQKRLALQRGLEKKRADDFFVRHMVMRDDLDTGTAKKWLDAFNREFATGSLSLLDEEALGQAIFLAWLATHWSDAKRFAGYLAVDAPNSGEVSLAEQWKRLTDAAKYLWQGRYEMAQNLLPRQAKGQEMETHSLSAVAERAWQQWEQYVSRHLYRLAMEANEDNNVVEAAHRCSQALRIFQDNADAENLLKGIKTQVLAQAAQMAQDMDRFDFTAKNLSEVQIRLREAEALLQRAQQLHRSLRTLKDTEQLENINSSMKELAKKQAQWQKAVQYLESFDKAYDKALQNPQSKRWQFDGLSSFLDDASNAVNNDDWDNIVRQYRARLKEGQETAEKLQELMEKFFQALRAGEFSSALEHINALKEQWDKARNEQGFAGLDSMLHFPYPNGLGTADALQDHEQLIKKLQREQDDWAGSLDEAESELKALQRDLENQGLPKNWDKMSDEEKEAYALQQVFHLVGEDGSKCPEEWEQEWDELQSRVKNMLREVAEYEENLPSLFEESVRRRMEYVLTHSFVRSGVLAQSPTYLQTLKAALAKHQEYAAEKKAAFMKLYRNLRRVLQQVDKARKNRLKKKFHYLPAHQYNKVHAAWKDWKAVAPCDPDADKLHDALVKIRNKYVVKSK